MSLKRVYLVTSRCCFYLATIMFFLVAACLLSALIRSLPPDPTQAAEEDPLVGFNFRLDLDGSSAGYFTNCSHIGSENEVVEHTLPTGWVQKVPGELAWNNVILSRGITSDTQMWEWRRQVEEGDMMTARQHVSIVMLDSEGTEVVRWELTNAWPCRIEGPSVLGSEDIGIEEIEIVCERMERVTASYSGPEMIIKGNSFEIVDGDVTPSAADGTDFGSANTATGSVVHAFIIKNIGTTQLNLTGDPVTVGGACAADFTVTAQPASTVAADGGSTTFEVTFDPSAAGVRTATISIANDDPDENPFDVLLSGNGETASFSITKTGPAISKVGDTVTYTVNITNTGQITLVTDNITDSKAGVITGLFHKSTLNLGDSDNATYDYTVQAGDSDPLVNTVTAYYHLEQDANLHISGSDNCSVDLRHPNILVTKSAAPGTYGAGDSITYTATIINTSSDITLERDRATDSMADNITGLCPPTIAQGASANVTYTYTVKATDPDPLVNLITVHYHPQGLPNDITDNTTCSVDLAPTITSVTPKQGIRGQTLDIVITGSQLNRVNAVDFGTGITVNGLAVNSSTQITANISIDANATLWPRDVTVTNPTGSDTLIGGFTVKRSTSLQPPSVAPRTPRTSPQPPRPTISIVSLQYLNIHPQQTHANQPVIITTNVVNTGDAVGSYNVILKINGRVEQTRMVSVGPQGTQPVKFTTTKAQPGTYTVNIGNQRGSFIVTGAGSGSGGGMVEGPLIAAVVAVIVMLVGVVIIIARRRFQGY